MGADPDWGLSTLSVHGAGPGADAERLPPSTPTVQPIYQTSVYSFPDLASLDAVQDGTAEGYIYGRYGLPNHTALERAVAALEGGEAALACASGMGATAAALLAALSGGGKVAAAREVYGGTYGLLEELGRFGVGTTWVDAENIPEVEAALAEGCRLLLVALQVIRPNPDRRFCRGSCRRRAPLAPGLRHPLRPCRNSLHCGRRPRGSHSARRPGGPRPAPPAARLQSSVQFVGPALAVRGRRVQ